MICAASVSYTDLISELQRRCRTKRNWDEPSYVESLLFDLHMAQKCLQRAIYDQQVEATKQPFRRSSRFLPQSEPLNSRLDYPER